MKWISRALLVVSVTMLLLVVARAYAVETETGEVVELDAQAGMITIDTDGQGVLQLTAPASLMTELQPGDEVRVEFEGKMVRRIQKLPGPAEDRKPGTEGGSAGSDRN